MICKIKSERLRNDILILIQNIVSADGNRNECGIFYHVARPCAAAFYFIEKIRGGGAVLADICFEQGKTF